MNLADIQYIQNIPQENIIKISDRLVALEVITQDDKVRVLKWNHMVLNGREVAFRHPDYMRFIQRIASISRKLSSHMRRNHNHYPPIQRGERRNAYQMADFQAFGDEIIRAYVLQHPPNTWGVDWDWGA